MKQTNNIIDFWGYKMTGKELTPEQYDNYLFINKDKWVNDVVSRAINNKGEDK